MIKEVLSGKKIKEVLSGKKIKFYGVLSEPSGFKTITINVKSDSNNLPYVKITIAEDYKITDFDGNAQFQLRFGIYNYILERAGYETVEDYLNVGIANETVNYTIERLLYNDWYLPAYNLLPEFYNIKDIDVINDEFNKSIRNELYWTSREWSATYAKRYNPFLLVGGNNLKNSSLIYRPVRVFTSNEDYSIGDRMKDNGWVIYKIPGTPNTYYVIYAVNIGAEEWSNIDDVAIGTTQSAIGSGQTNSEAIIGQAGHTDSVAKSCLDLSVAGRMMFYRDNPQPLFTVFVDDGGASLYTGWYPVFTALDIVGVAAIVPDWIGDVNHISWVHLREMYASGWEIASHSKTHWSLTGGHGDPIPTEADIIDELSLSKQALEDEDFTVHNFVWAYGDFNENLQQMVMEYYRAARAYAEPDGPWLMQELNENPFDLSIVRSAPCDVRRDITIEAQLNEVKALVDEAYSNNKWLTVTLHGYDAAEGTAFIDLINYVKTKEGMQIVTMNQALDLIQ